MSLETKPQTNSAQYTSNCDSETDHLADNQQTEKSAGRNGSQKSMKKLTMAANFGLRQPVVTYTID